MPPEWLLIMKKDWRLCPKHFPKERINRGRLAFSCPKWVVVSSKETPGGPELTTEHSGRRKSTASYNGKRGLAD